MKRGKVTSAILIAFVLCFIWGHSMVSAEVSKTESLAVGGFLTPFLELFVGRGNVTDRLVRKLAHFSEFAVLGVLLSVNMRAYERKGRVMGSYYILLGMAAAVIDESIQLFSVGRGAQVQDILLDTAGAVCGGLITKLAFRLFSGKSRKE